MPDEPDRLSIAADVDVGALQAVLRDAFGVGVLVLVAAVVPFLPGATRTIPGVAVTIGALIASVVWLGVVIAILIAAPAVDTLVWAAVDGPAEVVHDLATAARYGLGLVAILLAHRGLAPVVVPFLVSGDAWTYDIVFLGFALVPLVAIGHRLYRDADLVARDAANALLGRDDGRAETGQRESA